MLTTAFVMMFDSVAGVAVTVGSGGIGVAVGVKVGRTTGVVTIGSGVELPAHALSSVMVNNRMNGVSDRVFGSFNQVVRMV
jgi:hypothetical protein